MSDVMFVQVRMFIEVPGDARPSAVMAAAMDAVDQVTPYKVTKAKLIDSVQNAGLNVQHGRSPKWKIAREDAMTRIKQAIRAELEISGTTQANLAAYCGLSEKHVSQVLTGKVAGTFGTLANMAAACGLTIIVVFQPEDAS